MTAIAADSIEMIYNGDLTADDAGTTTSAGASATRP